jgi:hypothetical protein
MKKISLVLEFVFGCWHRNISRPFTLSGWTYEVCLNCGRKFAYDRAEIMNAVLQRNLPPDENSSEIGRATLAGRNDRPTTLDIKALGEASF